MKQRKYTQGMTFFVTPEMYQAVIDMSNQQGVSVSELIRSFIHPHLSPVTTNNQESKESINGKY